MSFENQEEILDSQSESKNEREAQEEVADNANESTPQKEFELTREKEEELTRLAHIFIDKVKGNEEGFDGMDGADASGYLWDGYRRNGMTGVQESIKALLDRAKKNPAYKGTSFESGNYNEELAAAIVKEGMAQIQKEAVGGLKEKISRKLGR